MNNDQRSSHRGARAAPRVSLPQLARALAHTDRPGLRRKTYVADRLVLTVVEHDTPAASLSDAESNGRAEPDPVLFAGKLALPRRAIVEALAGRRVTATLSGHHHDPHISFALFLLQE
jgi:hypothetical protein